MSLAGTGDEAFDAQTAQGIEEKEKRAVMAKAAKYKEYEEVPDEEGTTRQRKRPQVPFSDAERPKGSLFLGGKSAFNNSVKRSGKDE